jgi:hypothetical protein
MVVVVALSLSTQSITKSTATALYALATPATLFESPASSLPPAPLTALGELGEDISCQGS